MILGVTGCPGSGKSVVTATLASMGWRLIDADVLGRTVVEKNQEVVEALAEEFGSDIIRADGTLDRRLTAHRAFATHEATTRLNAIVHPVLISELLRDMAVTTEEIHTVVDCALIYEWGIGERFDFIVCVHADPERRIERIMARDGRSREEVLQMFDAQLPEEEKIRRADLAIANDGTLARIESLARLLAPLAEL